MKQPRHFLATSGTALVLYFITAGGALAAPAEAFNGVDNSLSRLYRISEAQSRSISPENPTGEPGKGAMATEGLQEVYARNLGQGWKINPAVLIEPGRTFTLADVNASGAIEHIWLTPTGNWRTAILRFYWDGETDPSVEVPVGDFFGMGLGKYAPLDSLAVSVNPGSGFNSYWVMPFRKRFRITVENIASEKMILFYQIDYTLTNIDTDAAYFHAQFRRVSPVKEKEVYTILDGVRGQGQYVGTYMTWGINHPGWWGEGEIKFYLDGDQRFPTVAGTGTEDYFGGAYDFVNQATHRYEEFSHSYSGMPQVIRPEDTQSSPKFSLYRWHISDPIRFMRALRVTIQDLGFKEFKTSKDPEYLSGHDDISSVAYWYQVEPHATFPKLPSKVELEAQ